MKNTKASGPGHPPTDVARRLRHWVWYWTIKQATGCSDERLDELYLPANRTGNRRRFFQRIRSVGSDPTRLRSDLNGISVFERVHEGNGAPALRAAERDFKSWLWVLLTQPTLRLEDHRQFIDQLMAERGWYRHRHEDRLIIATYLVTDPSFGYPEGADNVYSAMLTHLEAHPTADHVALLAALFREAMTEVDLAKAIVLRSSLLVCTRRWASALGIPEVQQRLLVHLVEQRLIHQQWFTPELALRSYPSQRQYIQALVEAHLATLTPYHSANSHNARYPIVRRSPRIAWLEAHRDVLAPIARQLTGPDAIDSWSPEEADQINLTINDPARQEAWTRKRAEASKAWRDLADHAFKMASPPPQDMRYCLPVEPGSPYRNDERPLPYLDDGHLDTQAGRSKRLAPRPRWTHGDAPPPLKARGRSKK